MTTTSELITAVDQVRAGLSSALDQAAHAHRSAEELTDSAAAHGWEGVASSTRAVAEALEAAQSSLDSATQATASAMTVLASITEQMGRHEVAEHLAGVVNHVDQAGTALNAAADSTEDAHQAAQQAGEPHELMSLLQGLTDTLDQTRRDLDNVRSSTESERGSAASWGN